MPKYLTTDEIREKYINFFAKEHQHTLVESSSLVPDNPTVLLTTAGMLQFLPYFLGLEQPPYNPARATSCQKCARAGGKDSDIENVGRTPRHHTFFEMLGNFSFGDYYKKEVIPWAWDFVTNHLGLEKERLWVTIFETDDEAYELWTTLTDIKPERILRKGKKDNFWGPPGATGSCGPCSEIHYDLGEQFKCSDDCGIDTCECDRWVEIWNLVFTELFQDEEGNQSPLEKKNVDTGMGLERIAMVVQGKSSTFETDLLQKILNKASEITGVKYKANDKTDVSLRIITDHARCVSFLIADGVTPGNEGRSYVLRMILRRALRHGKILGVDVDFLHNLVPTVVECYGKTYPELVEKQAKIIDVITKEENRFKQTLDRGQKLLDEVIQKELTSDKTISGEDAFKLYDTFGFPLELTVEIAAESNVNVDVDAFKVEMENQRERAKASVQKIVLTDELVYANIEKDKGSTDFIGYEKLSCEDAKVIAIVKDGEVVEAVDSSDEIVDIMLDKTPFYAESGGQVGDVGTICAKGFEAEVANTFKVNKLFVQRVNIVDGEIKVGDIVSAKVDVEKRQETRVHHSLAHLLQAALIKILGDEVHQAGSQVDMQRTRFDFSFPRAMSKDEIKKVEDLINGWISDRLEQHTEVMDVNEARSQGAMALFGEKYDEKVRVVSIGNISKELCGGTHIDNTSELRVAKIVSESAISAGSRRIEAVCSKAAIKLLTEKAEEIDSISQALKTPVVELGARIDKIVAENRDMQNEINNLKAEVAKYKFGSFVSKAKDINGGKLLVSKVEAFEPNVLKVAMEELARKLGESVIILVSQKEDGTGMILVRVSDSLVKSGINAGKLVGEIAQQCGGKGGGKPNFAQGGAKDLSNINEILAKIESQF
ncbi:alanine--tRNA ligase [bacterium]|nr:alanine--tRNA ligase [bacterium]